MAPRNAINTVNFSISMFKVDNWYGFKIINIPNHPNIDAKIRFLEIFSLINMPAKIDMKIG